MDLYVTVLHVMELYILSGSNRCWRHPLQSMNCLTRTSGKFCVITLPLKKVLLQPEILNHARPTPDYTKHGFSF